MTLPMSITVLFFSDLEVTEIGHIFLFIMDAISFSYHALSFVVLFATNKRIATEFVNLIHLRQTRAKSALSTTLPKIVIQNASI